MDRRLMERLVARGHPEVRSAHGNVFQYLDDEGTRVSLLAERAQVSKQAMAQLVAHLEAHGYVERVADPADGRAKLVRATGRGRDVYRGRPRAGGRSRGAADRPAGRGQAAPAARAAAELDAAL